MAARVHSLAVRMTRTWAGVALLEARWSIDLAAGVQLLHRLNHLVEHGDVRCVVDLSLAPSCGTTGLAALVVCHDRAMARGGWVRIAGPQPQVLQLLSSTDPPRLLPVYPTVEAALTADVNLA